MSRSLCACLALAAAFALLTAEPARAEEGSPFVLRSEVDAPVVLAATAFWALPALFEDALAPGRCRPCDPGGVNALDRTAIGNRDEIADAASDIGAVGLPLLAGMGAFIEVERFGWGAALEDAVLVAEAVAVSGAVNQMVRNAIVRPRPFMYDAGRAAEEGLGHDNFHSFYSGHTSTAFAAAVAFAAVYSIRRPEGAGRYAVWAFGLAAASAVGVCRVRAGEHFWTDAIAGAVAGGAIGVAIPALHLRRGAGRKRAELRAVAGPGAAALSVRF
jgi:membrane-associated phospholipid phosphatase